MDNFKKKRLMDAGTILYHSAEGFGPNLGQLKKELEQFGKVTVLAESKEVPELIKGWDFLVDLSNIFSTKYLVVKLADSTPANPSKDTEGREIRRYAIELLATPHKSLEKTIAQLKNKYRE